MRIGLDLDNTIICYDGLFYNAARELNLIPHDLSRSRDSVRDYLRAAGKEDEWTKLQGYVYGPAMTAAVLYPGVEEFLSFCKQHQITAFIISHRTKHPYLGPRHDLHRTAHEWIVSRGLVDSDLTNITRERIFLEASTDDKIRRIKECNCSVFVDDLPEFLHKQNFPFDIHRILFDPDQIHKDSNLYERVLSWKDLLGRIRRMLQLKV